MDLLGAMFTTVPIGNGTLALVVSAAAAACALLLLGRTTEVASTLRGPSPHPPAWLVVAELTRRPA